METTNLEVKREEQKPKVTRNKNKHYKSKLWDDESIDHWKIEKFDPAWNKAEMLEVSTFLYSLPSIQRGYWPRFYHWIRLHMAHDYILMWKDRGFLYMNELDIGLQIPMICGFDGVRNWLG
ncbi:hypothetical protein M9H77_08712 [Catharanthus roseus]|uniref:Uncharacterized protein n=1 Tax=Catharanthus roseus TaxID=4058 RepID=A0ACC0BYR4_CATRO|nr:hypothetical protein M9H77_08712 [Catharanthus roseus]